MVRRRKSMLRLNQLDPIKLPIPLYSKRVTKLENITEDVLDTLFPDENRFKRAVLFRHCTIVGMPESGKTVLSKWLVFKAYERYGQKHVNAVSGMRFGDLIGFIDERPVQIIIVDDAVTYQHSRSRSHNIDIPDFFRIRHIFKEKRKNGNVVVIFITQRFRSLDIVFRNAQVLIFKSTLIDPSDQKLIYDYIGDTAYNYLMRLMEKMYGYGDHRAKSYSIAKILWLDDAGILKSKYVDLDLRFIEPIIAAASIPGGDGRAIPSTQGIVIDIEDIDLREALLEAMHKMGAERRHIDWLREYFYGSTMRDISSKFGYAPSTIAESLKKIRESLMGYAWEAVFHEILKKRYPKAEIIRGGRNTAEPDFIVKPKNQQPIVFSVKCYYDRKKVITLPLEEIAQSEYQYAKNHNAKLIISLYNPYYNKIIEAPIDVHSFNQSQHITFRYQTDNPTSLNVYRPCSRAGAGEEVGGVGVDRGR